MNFGGFAVLTRFGFHLRVVPILLDFRKFVIELRIAVQNIQKSFYFRFNILRSRFRGKLFHVIILPHPPLLPKLW